MDVYVTTVLSIALPKCARGGNENEKRKLKTERNWRRIVNRAIDTASVRDNSHVCLQNALAKMSGCTTAAY